MVVEEREGSPVLLPLFLEVSSLYTLSTYLLYSLSHASKYPWGECHLGSSVTLIVLSCVDGCKTVELSYWRLCSVVTFVLSCLCHPVHGSVNPIQSYAILCNPV